MGHRPGTRRRQRGGSAEVLQGAGGVGIRAFDLVFKRGFWPDNILMVQKDLSHGAYKNAGDLDESKSHL